MTTIDPLYYIYLTKYPSLVTVPHQIIGYVATRNGLSAHKNAFRLFHITQQLNISNSTPTYLMTVNPALTPIYIYAYMSVLCTHMETVARVLTRCRLRTCERSMVARGNASVFLLCGRVYDTALERLHHNSDILTTILSSMWSVFRQVITSHSCKRLMWLYFYVLRERYSEFSN
ncbi:hypothetical protein ALC53_12266 [Atta colombica]|uniref:Uncharacterized protein n=1 Tax=Atta colombica TaxID=520822 RepID=A0A195AZ22_9HYME|nr:hypothetical protein ALC53_12266 [Atta colombica]